MNICPCSSKAYSKEEEDKEEKESKKEKERKGENQYETQS